MALVAFSFGSLGDIITVIGLLNEVRIALCDSKGSSAEYQALLIDLDIFHDTLEAVRDTFSPPNSNHPALLLSLQNAHQQALSVSHMLLKDSHDRIAKYQSNLRKGGSGSMMKDSWRKIGWALFQKPELEEIRRKMVAQVEAHNILLSLALRSVPSVCDYIALMCHMLTGRPTSCDSRDDARQQHNAILQIDRSVQELPTVIRDTIAAQRAVLFELKHCVNELPNILGYTWEGGLTPSQRPVILTDALGQSLRLPLELCQSYEILDGILKVYFKKRAGGRYVERGDYELTILDCADTRDASSASTSLVECRKDHNREVALVSHVDDWEWKKLVTAGLAIDMNVVVRRKASTHSIGLGGWRQARNICPNCSFDNSEPTPKGGYGIRHGSHMLWSSAPRGIKCAYCQVWFQNNAILADYDEYQTGSGPVEETDDEPSEELVSPQLREQLEQDDRPNPFRPSSKSQDEIHLLRRMRIVKSLVDSHRRDGNRFPDPVLAELYYLRATMDEKF